MPWGFLIRLACNEIKGPVTSLSSLSCHTDGRIWRNDVPLRDVDTFSKAKEIRSQYFVAQKEQRTITTVITAIAIIVLSGILVHSSIQREILKGRTGSVCLLW
jgi:hypothetical protein